MPHIPFEISIPSLVYAKEVFLRNTHFVIEKYTIKTAPIMNAFQESQIAPIPERMSAIGIPMKIL
jgi:hypothetical protein